MNDQSNCNFEAIALAESLRADHNGIGGVYLFLGHDGHNECTLKDIDARPVAHGESGRMLLEAVERAAADWRRAQFWRRRKVLEVAWSAAMLYAGAREHCNGTFNTASFQGIVRQEANFCPTPDEAVALLSAEPCVVRLSGGHHWLILPSGYTRFIEPEVGHEG